MNTKINGVSLEAYALCACACGDRTNSPKSIYRPGHDAKHVTKLVWLVVAGTMTRGAAISYLPSNALIVKFENALSRVLIKEDKTKRANAFKAKINDVATTNFEEISQSRTLKIGRWTYPAKVYSSGSVFYNSKRDGTGEWLPMPPKAELVF